MKQQKIVIVVMLFIGTITFMCIVQNKQKYIMQDGMMLALTLDGSVITSFPERGAYNVEIDCGDTATGKWLAEEWKLAIEDIAGVVKCNISFTSNPTTLKSKVETVNASQNYNSHGYRYSGKTPSNWIWFNGEKWRIIGSIPTCTSSGCATSENLVKIIRSASIGSYSYDASSTLQPIWGSNTLYKLLNTHYYAEDKSSMNGQNHAGCYSYGSSQKAKPNCNYSEIGILANSYYGRMIKNVYWNTGTNNSSYAITPSVSYTNEIAKQTVSGYVGLMTASDWGYAVPINYHSKTMANPSSGLYSYARDYSWIVNGGAEWLSTSKTSKYSGISNGSGSLGTGYVTYGYIVRPVVYLDSSVYIISGDGTEGNPYQIGIGMPGKISSGFYYLNSALDGDYIYLFPDEYINIDYQTDGEVTCNSSDPSVATCNVDESSKTIEISAVAVGETTISLQAAEGELYESSSLTFELYVEDSDEPGIPEEDMPA